MPRAYAELTFTPNVRAMQERQGSSEAYAKFLSPEASGGDRMTAREVAFIQEREAFYQATVSETGWPYVQFKGGPKGFLKVLDDKRLAYADFKGNRQYLSVGNLQANDRVSLFLMDYPNKRRLKILGTVELVDAADNPDLIARLHDPEYRATVERAFMITIAAFDWNCPAHISQRFTVDEFNAMLESGEASLNG